MRTSRWSPALALSSASDDGQPPLHSTPLIQSWVFEPAVICEIPPVGTTIAPSRRPAKAWPAPMAVQLNCRLTGVVSPVFGPTDAPAGAPCMVVPSQ